MSIWPHKNSNDFQFSPLEQSDIHQADWKYTLWGMEKEKSFFFHFPHNISKVIHAFQVENPNCFQKIAFLLHFG